MRQGVYGTGRFSPKYFSRSACVKSARSGHAMVKAFAMNGMYCADRRILHKSFDGLVEYAAHQPCKKSPRLKLETCIGRAAAYRWPGRQRGARCAIFNMVHYWSLSICLSTGTFHMGTHSQCSQYLTTNGYHWVVEVASVGVACRV